MPGLVEFGSHGYFVMASLTTDRDEHVIPLPSPMVKSVTWVVRILLGFVFLFSSAGKIADPAAFAAIVNNYQLLSPKLVLATAVVLPWIEALCGLALVFGRFEKGRCTAGEPDDGRFYRTHPLQWLSRIEHRLRLFFAGGQSAIEYRREHAAQSVNSGSRGMGPFFLETPADNAGSMIRARSG
jgi:hypothetical protein